jgi:hypothetical protein
MCAHLLRFSGQQGQEQTKGQREFTFSDLFFSCGWPEHVFVCNTKHVGAPQVLAEIMMDRDLPWVSLRHRDKVSARRCPSRRKIATREPGGVKQPLQAIQALTIVGHGAGLFQVRELFVPLLRITLMELEVLYQAAESHAVVMAAKQKYIDDNSNGSRAVRGTLMLLLQRNQMCAYVVTTALLWYINGFALLLADSYGSQKRSE